MSIPEWATHIAVDEDGEVCAFDREPVFLEADCHTCGVWALPGADKKGLVVILRGAKSLNADVYPSEIARLLCVALPQPSTETKNG